MPRYDPTEPDWVGPLAEPSPWQNLDATLATLERSIADPAFWIGLSLVCLFAWSRFKITRASEDEIDPPLEPRSFTTLFRYLFAASAYVAGYLFVFLFLVTLGSYPDLQRFLIALFGSLEVDGATVGTPAWAALITTSLLPSLPVFRPIDNAVRDFLHRCADIPDKAHGLAEALVAGLKSSPAAPADNAGEEAALPEPVRIAQELHAAAGRLRRSKWNRENAADYRTFFAKHEEFYQGTVQRTEDVIERAQGGRLPPKAEREIDAIIDRCARYLVCAALSNERSEGAIARRLNAAFGRPVMPEPDFQFSINQILLGLVFVPLATVALGLASLWWIGAPMTVEARIATVFQWVPYALTMYMMPLFFAAGVRLHLSDRQDLPGDPLPWEDRLVAFGVVFVVSFGLATLPLLVGVALGSDVEGGRRLIARLPFALGPAVFATAFAIIADIQVSRSRLVNAAVDFLFHGALAGTAAYGAAHLSAGLAGGSASPRAVHVSAWLFAIMAFGVAGLLGAMQCAASRRILPDRRRRNPLTRVFSAIRRPSGWRGSASSSRHSGGRRADTAAPAPAPGS